jgi:hypothetical protein
MKTATFSIPKRWQDDSCQIKACIEDYASAVGKSFEANIAAEADSGQICITDMGTLSKEQYEAADNAIHTLNNKLNRPNGDAGRARIEAKEELQAELAEIDRIFR